MLITINVHFKTERHQMHVFETPRESGKSDSAARVPDDLWFAIASVGGPTFTVTADIKTSEYGAAAEILVAGTVAHPKFEALPAVLPLLFIQDYPMKSVGKSESREELKKTIERLEGYLVDMRNRGGIVRLTQGPRGPSTPNTDIERPGDSSSGNLSEGEVKRKNSRLRTQIYRKAIGDFHFDNSNVKNWLNPAPKGRLSEDEVLAAAYFNLLKSIGYLDVRDAVFPLLLEKEDLSNQSDNRVQKSAQQNGKYVHSVVTKLTRQGVILSSKRIHN
jgi:hypothetical protein